ncbi:hypothetical protein ACFLT9_09935, partial [Acidobacteriota bacterium]
MTSVMICFKIASYEAKILLRSWGFRIFALLGLIFLGLLTFGIATPSFSFPYYIRSLSGSIPLFSLKLFNVFQGFIVVFMATEFFKRDRRTHTTQVIYPRSFTNTSYMLGKFLGVLCLFLLMNILAGLLTALIHLLLSETPFSFTAYILYFLTLNLPTLVFLIGLSFMLGVTIGSQAVVILIGLFLSSISLSALGSQAYFIFDIFGFHTPLFYSDFIGLGNSSQLFYLRFPYVLLGLGFVFGTVLLAKRLRQSRWITVLSGTLSVVLVLSACVLMLTHVQGIRNIDTLRRDILAASEKYKDVVPLSMDSCSLDVEFAGSTLSVKSDIRLKNNREEPVDSILLTLNPGLQVSRLTTEGQEIDFSRDGHILFIPLTEPLGTGENYAVQIEYTGTPLEAFCYVDIDAATLRKPSKMSLYNVPKRYVFLSDKFVHLTPESGWYPRSGIPLSHRFPGALDSDYTQYILKVRLAGGFNAVSQGLPEIEESSEGKIYTFRPKTPLPRISLTAGPFEVRTIKIKDIEYKIFSLPGHDYYTRYLDAIVKDLPKTINQLKDEFEVILGLDYPFEQLALVETPIHFTSHKRLWTAVDETVQPQLVLLPEMGTLCEGVDFASYSRWYRRMAGKGGVSKEISASQIQTSYFNGFVRTNLLGTQSGKGLGQKGAVASMRESDVNAEYNLMPNYFAFTTTLASNRWPILHSALESWLQDRIFSTEFRFDRSGGLTDQEKTNRLLQGRSLADLIADKSLSDRELYNVILTKGKHLMTIIESRIKEEKFGSELLNLIRGKKFSTITEDEFLQFLFAYKEFDLEPVMTSWYEETQVPAITIGTIGIYSVLDGEKKRHHINVPLTNLSDTEGIVKISLMTGASKSKVGKGGNLWENEGTILIPPETTKEIGYLMDDRPVYMTLDTTISRNIPAAMNMNLWQWKLNEADSFFEGERTTSYAESGTASIGEGWSEQGNLCVPDPDQL